MIKKHIPNAITCANLFSGCIGIVYAFNGALEIAAYFVLLSGIFDFFDGFAARLLHVKSNIGKELDSLADMVSFGFLPGVVMFQLLKTSDCTFPYLPYLGFIITVFSALRLAKFNIDSRQTEDFIGLNTPMNTIFIVSLPFIRKDYPLIVGSAPLLFGLTLILSWLLVSEIKIFSLKFSSATWAKNKIKYIFLLLSAILVIFLNFSAVPFILLLYIGLSFLHFRNTPI
ncbi:MULTISPECIES: CDP-diacylglycerol--serine O-phosphatidyltransferase [Pedobacter]|uniref:CDP-diacylglycerol--serine O-phosphatidyltransferase n=1 Tax=Pedobacter heparinus (strain ATCC 13125 / DSM 2366 / CIP 104194 / JCM 7457 / NBRC 12017 / NCIMB 9290 / NRRL B-14731 / HIM 762-3) TaxID=485917 RepID=C6Y2Q8_PEDHD|nr:MULTISPECIES: CDP-diacylglycerol--serine O-phosphatidyltransferase [Pedobacter]ACU05268.1 CDP-alcohol phosphatidyltransferase [Pedobacter heparinus DSM 2366]MBB5439598.1 CDP-diacylglycerol--serine O-phosphatidyltransferase [Pedobacter sp. AK017]